MRTLRPHRISIVITAAVFTIVAAIGHAQLPTAQAATGVQAQSADKFVDSIGVATHLAWAGTPNGMSSTLKSKLGEVGIRHLRDGWGSGSQSVDTFAQD